MSRVLALCFGLVAVVGLTALTVWETAPRIESDLEARTVELFDEMGLPQAAVRVDGRDITLRGGLGMDDRDRVLAELWRLSGVRSVESVYVARAPRLAASVLESVDTVAVEGDILDLEGATSSGQDQLEASGSEDAEVQAAEVALGDALADGAISFESGTATLTPGSREILDSVAAVLERYPRLVAEVQGHTDSEGDDGTNRRLSQRRADAVAAYLLEAGVPDSSLRAQGYGESEPIDTNDTPAGRSRNRRVVFALDLR